MNFLLPVWAAILQTGSATLDKVVLSMRRVSYRTYLGFSFPLIFFITLIIFLIARPPFDVNLLIGKYFPLILGSVVIVLISNLLYYKSLDKDLLEELQIISLVSNVPAIVFTSIIFTDERNYKIIALAILASLAILWSHWERKHFRIKKDTLIFLVWVLIGAPLGTPIAKELLRVWHPISLLLVRDGIAALIFGLVYFRYEKKIELKPALLLIFINALSTAAFIFLWMGYQKIGVVYTVLVFSLQPLLVYISSVILLKEKFQLKKALAFLVILISIGIAQIIR